jgi:hypothetical protein
MVLDLVLKELEDLWKNGMEITCPDGKVRIGHPVIAGWLGDYPEYMKLFTTSYMSCPICIAPRHQMDAHSSLPVAHRNVNPDELRANVKRYADVQTIKAQWKRTAPEHELAKKESDAIEQWFSLQRLRIVDNLLWRLPHVSPITLWKPDLLHTMDLGMIKHALEWMFNMLDEHGKGLPDLYDVTWMSVSPHPSIFVPKKKYRSVKQWSGKEYRNAASIMLSVLEATIDPYPADVEQQEIFDRSLDCLCALLNFYLMAQYKSHSFPANKAFDNTYRALWTGYTTPDPEDTISYLQHYLAVFHNTKSTFLKYRASKTVKRDAAIFASGSVPDITAEEEKIMTKIEIIARKKADAALKRQAKEEYILEHSSYNMPKVHVMDHFGETIPEVGALQQFSTTIVELNHQPLNLAYDQSNKVDATEQTLRYAGHKDAMSVRVANYTCLMQDPTVDEEVVKDIRLWLNIFGSKEARLAAARANRDRMKPKKANAEEKARKKAMKADRQALVEALRGQYGYGNLEDEDYDGNSSDDEQGLTFRDSTPGRLLKGRMLTIRVDGVPQSLMTVGHIETLLGVAGLVDAFLSLMKKEKVYTQASADTIRQLDASPYMAVRIRRPVFQSATELENHIIRCTAGENFRNSHPRADFIIYQPPNDGTKKVEFPVMGDRSVGQLRCFFRVRFPSSPTEQSSSRTQAFGRFAAIRPMVQLALTPSQLSRAMPRFEWAPNKEIMVIRVGSIERAACVVPILPSLRIDTPESPSELRSKATRFVLNTKVDLETFAMFY